MELSNWKDAPKTNVTKDFCLLKENMSMGCGGGWALKTLKQGYYENKMKCCWECFALIRTLKSLIGWQRLNFPNAHFTKHMEAMGCLEFLVTCRYPKPWTGNIKASESGNQYYNLFILAVVLLWWACQSIYCLQLHFQLILLNHLPHSLQTLQNVPLAGLCQVVY